MSVIGGLIAAALIGAVTFTVALVVVAVLLFVDGPEPPLDCDGRSIVRSQALSDQFQTRWDVLDDGGDTAQFDESEVTSRAFTHFDADRLRDVTVCTNVGAGTGSATINVPGLSEVVGDVRVRATGSADLSGGTPVVSITALEVGSLPSFLADRVATGPIADAVNRELRDVRARQRYAIEVLEGAVETASRSATTSTSRTSRASSLAHRRVRSERARWRPSSSGCAPTPPGSRRGTSIG